MKWHVLSAAMLVLSVALTGVAAADETVKLNAFPGAGNLAVWVGQREGLFARHGVTVELSHPKGSVDQMKGLLDGRYEILLTALDNVVAYRDGQGVAGVGTIDLVAIMGMDGGFLTLMAAPEIKTIAELKGKVMAVDALTTGYSFALQEILARAGIAKDQVSYVTVGSSGERWKTLQAGKAQAALLNTPTDLDAGDRGFVALATVAHTLSHYQATVAATQRSWAGSHRITVVNFLHGYGDAVTWLVAPEHKDAVIDILHQEMPTLAVGSLGRIAAQLMDPREGIARDLAIDPAGAQMVLDLRAKYAEPARPAGDWHNYADLSYLAEARK